MPESIIHDFSIFSKEQIQPVVDAVIRRKRNCLYPALGAGLGIFLVFAGAIHFFFVPYRDMLIQYGISANFWGMTFLAPLSLGMFGFCLVYILCLRRAVNKFRASLLDKFAEFIDPAIFLTTGKKLPNRELEGGIVAAIGGKPLSGTTQFHYRMRGVTAHFSDLRIIKGNSKSDGSCKMLAGLYFYAVMERKFATPILVIPSSAEIDESEFKAKLYADGDAVGPGLLKFDDPSRGRRILVPSGGEGFISNLLSSPAFTRLESLRRHAGSALYLSCRGDGLRVALLSSSKLMELPGELDGFDFGHSREFCCAARLCLDLACNMAERNDLWLEQKIAMGM